MLKRLVASIILLLCGVDVVVPQRAHAVAAIHDAASTGVSDSTLTITKSFTTTTGARKLLACVAVEDNSFNVTSVTWNGVAMTALANNTKTPDVNGFAGIYYLDSPAIGTFDVVATSDASVNEWGITVLSLSGTATGVGDGDSSASDAATTATLALAGVLATDFVFTCAMTGAATATWTHGANQNELSDFAFGAVAGAASSTSWELGEAGPSSTASNSSRFVLVGAAFPAASSRRRENVFLP